MLAVTFSLVTVADYDENSDYDAGMIFLALQLCPLCDKALMTVL